MEINKLKIKPIIEGKTCKYLDENLRTKISPTMVQLRKKENLNSQLLINKIAQNCFAIAALAPTFGILDETFQDVKDIDIRTREILNMTSNFNRSSDIDRLYIPRSMGVRGLRSIQTAHDLKIISFKQHLVNIKSQSANMENVYENEKEKCI